MKRIVFLVIFFCLGQTVCAADLFIVAESEHSSGCDLAEADFDEKESFLKFFPKLKEVAKKPEADKFVALMLFPLKVNRAKTEIIKDEKEFKSRFSSIMTTKILKVISDQKLEDLSCQYQGVMFGNGELWVQKKQGKVGISALNP